ncbi:MAG: hypothetical protein JWM11_6219 [Planctomycetaceae bacterium]|nr:hypothetical protein [Planctomycetaceae bacterium]
MVSRWLHWILLCTWVLCFLVGGMSRTLSWAEERTDGERGVLLLEGNRIVEGRISASRETLNVTQDSAGILVIPKAQVRFQGTDLRSAYVFLLDELPNMASADDHVRLARWCISYKLMPEARFELQSALDLEPGRDDIRRNLSILDSHIKRPPREEKSTNSLTPAERQARMLGMGGDVESLGGLTREAGQQFTTRIQPILVHNCTNSACHGPLAKHPLKFSIVRVGANSSHALSEKNLLALMKYVDREHPKASPLWRILTTNHDAQGSSIFTGLKGPQQLQTFKDWILSLSNAEETDTDKSSSAPKKEDVTKSSEGKQGPAASNKAMVSSEPESDELPVSQPSKESRKRTTSKARSRIQEDSRITERRPVKKTEKPDRIAAPLQDSTERTDSNLPEVEPIVSKTRTAVPELSAEDAFDPEVFNRKQRNKRNLANEYR